MGDETAADGEVEDGLAELGDVGGAGRQAGKGIYEEGRPAFVRLRRDKLGVGGSDEAVAADFAGVLSCGNGNARAAMAWLATDKSGRPAGAAGRHRHGDLPAWDSDTAYVPLRRYRTPSPHCTAQIYREYRLR